MGIKKNPSLQVVGNQPSNDELQSVAESMLKDCGADPDTKVTDVLNYPQYSGFKRMIIQRYYIEKKEREAAQRAEEARQQKELEEKRAEESAKLEAMACAKFGLELPPKPLTTEELKEAISTGAKLAMVGMVPTQEPPIPEAITQLNEKLGEKLPGFVFKDQVLALAFRGWLGYHVKKVNNELAKAGLTNEFRQALVQRRQEFAALFEAIGPVVKAWGLDPKTDQSEMADFNEVRGRLEKPDSRFYWLTKLPQVETLEQKTAREQTELEAKAVAEANQAAKAALRSRLVERLMGLDLVDLGKDKLLKEQAEAMAGCLAKKYKHLVSQGDEAMFRLAAIDKKAGAKTAGDEATALIYAKAGNMTLEALESAVNTRHQEMQKEREKERERRQTPGYGAEKTETANARKKNKKGGGCSNNKKQQNGRQNRSNQ